MNNSVGPKVRKINVQNTLDSGKDMLFDGTSDYPIYSINTAKVPTFPTTITPALPQKQSLDRLPLDNPRADQTDLPLTKRIENFSEIVSIVGLRYAFVPNSSRVKRLLWLSLVLFGGGFMIYQIHDRVLYYLTWPTTVDLRVKYNSTLRFPTVTICNENRMRSVAAHELGVVGILQEILPPFPEVENFKPNYSAFNPLDFDPDWFNVYGELSQPITEAVFKCVYEMQYCNMTEAFDITPTNMGFCFSFNPRRINYVTARPGATNGLNLVLYVNQGDYLISNSPSAGFRVLLHEPDEKPLMKQWGFKVTPGYDTMIAITLANLTMLPNPYGDCTDARGYVYSDCMAVCEGKYIMRVCGCREPDAEGIMKVCNPEEEDKCVLNATDSFVFNGEAEACQCPRQCHQRTYQYTISQAEFSEYFADFITTYTFKNYFTTDFLRQNFVILEIFYSELTYEDIQTLASYDILSLLCDIGGALGLILGSTVLTLFEIVDFIFTVGWDIFWKRRAAAKAAKAAK